jgi:tetratricopeptide (TPR) repeat protein
MILRSILLLSIFCFPLITSAIGSFKPTASELRLLPEYCKPRATGWGDDIKDPRVKRWYAIFGGDWRHMHHYCKGLNHINKGNSLVDNRIFHYKTAISEFAYCIRQAKSEGYKSVLLPLLYTKTGDAYANLDNKPIAERYYRKSINKFPKYLSAYKRLVTLLIRSNRFKEAKIINDQGLDKFSKSKFFKRKEPKIEKGLTPE